MEKTPQMGSGQTPEANEGITDEKRLASAVIARLKTLHGEPLRSNRIAVHTEEQVELGKAIAERMPDEFGNRELAEGIEFVIVSPEDAKVGEDLGDIDDLSQG